MHLLFAFVLLFSPFPQARGPSDARLASIQVKGTHRYTLEDVMRLSGLEIGKPITVDDFTAAANRLVATGLFDMVKYTYTLGRQMTITFDVTEASWTVPVIFDNFIWMTVDELTAAVRAEVPTFDGTAPINQGAADFIAHALQDVLKARGIAGHVGYVTQSDLSPGGKMSKPAYMFAVSDPRPKLCALHAAGASGIPEKDLIAPISSAVGDDYSRFFLVTASRGTLHDMYLRRGYWRVAFAEPTVTTDACQGASATLHVTEGAQYIWDSPSWSGNSVLTTAAIESTFGMKIGEVADSTKIDNGVRNVGEAYGKRGYILANVRFDPVLDDAARKTTFRCTVDEGPQFHMGVLQFPNLAEANASTLKGRFRLKAGDVYDASYVKEYLQEQIYPLQTKNGLHPSVDTKVNSGTKVVDLVIVFK